GGGAIGVVVGDHETVLPHPGTAQRGGEALRIGQGVATSTRCGGGRQLGGQIDVDGAGQVSLEVVVAALGAVEGPPHVQQVHGPVAVEETAELGEVDDRCERGHAYLLCQAACSRQVVEVGFSGVGVCVRASAWVRVRVRQRRRAIWFFRQRRASITVFPSARSRS